MDMRGSHGRSAENTTARGGPSGRFTAWSATCRCRAPGASSQATFEFDGAAAQAAFNQLAHIFNAAASEGAFLMQVASGDHDATAYFASLEGSSAANVHVIQTAHGFIIQ